VDDRCLTECGKAVLRRRRQRLIGLVFHTLRGPGQKGCGGYVLNGHCRFSSGRRVQRWEYARQRGLVEDDADGIDTDIPVNKSDYESRTCTRPACAGTGSTRREGRDALLRRK